MKRTIAEWLSYYETAIIGDSGFPKNYRIHKTLITEKEFLNCCRNSTMKYSDKLKEAVRKELIHK